MTGETFAQLVGEADTADEWPPFRHRALSAFPVDALADGGGVG